MLTEKARGFTVEVVIEGETITPKRERETKMPKRRALYRNLGRADDPWIETLSKVLTTLEGRISTPDLWKILDKSKNEVGQADSKRLAGVMRRLGFERRIARIGRSDPQVAYIRGNFPNTNQVIAVIRDPITGAIMASIC